MWLRDRGWSSRIRTEVHHALSFLKFSLLIPNSVTWVWLHCVSLSISPKTYLGACSNNDLLMHAETQEFVFRNKWSQVCWAVARFGLICCFQGYRCLLCRLTFLLWKVAVIEIVLLFISFNYNCCFHGQNTSHYLKILQDCKPSKVEGVNNFEFWLSEMMLFTEFQTEISMLLG